MAEIRFTRGGDYDVANSETVAGFRPTDPVIVSRSDLGWIRFVPGEGVDLIRATDGYRLNPQTDSLYLSAADSASRSDAFGGDLGDVFVGSDFGDLLFGFAGNDSLTGGGDDDYLDGGIGADMLSGGDGNDRLYGDAGADALDGGEGNDTASFEFASGSVIVNLEDGMGLFGEAEGDVYVSIENVIGGVFNDSLTGSSRSVNILDGGAGADELYARGFGDILIGGSDGDYLSDNTRGPRTTTASYVTAATGVTASLADASLNTGDAAGDFYNRIGNLTGSAFNDRLIGDALANVLTGGAGRDRLDGGEGIDTASYSSAFEGVYIDLNEGRGRRGDAAGDVFTSIENVTGSDFQDVLIGTASDEMLIGGGGNDRIVGGGGKDRIEAGAGNDVVTLSGLSFGGGLSADGGVGTDTLVIAANSAIIAGAEAISGFESVSVGGNSTLILDQIGENLGIIRLGGSAGDTGTVIGTRTDDRIISGAGSDTLVGGLGADIVVGGAGQDTFAFLSLDEISDGDRINDFSHAQGDRINLSGILISYDWDGPRMFAFIGTEAFSGAGDEVRVMERANGAMTVQLDTDADGVSDHSFFDRADAPLVAEDFIF